MMCVLKLLKIPMSVPNLCCRKQQAQCLMFLLLTASQTKLPVFGFVWRLFWWVFGFFSPGMYKMPCKYKDSRCSTTHFGIAERTVKFCLPTASFFIMIYSCLLLDNGSEQSWRSYFSVSCMEKVVLFCLPVESPNYFILQKEQKQSRGNESFGILNYCLPLSIIFVYNDPTFLLLLTDTF